MKIAIVGTQCNGKSTFIKKFLEIWPMYKQPSKTYRDIISEKKLKLNQKGNEESQRAILDALIDELQYASANDGKDIIFDRCVLDNIVYRLGFAETRAQARQLVSHGMFEVNGQKVNIPSYQTSVGDVIKFREIKKKTKYAEQLKQKKNSKTQEWVESSSQELSGKVLSLPTPEQIDNKINTQLIVEYYSR